MDSPFILLWIVFIICAFFVWYFYHRARHEERMKMIERGSRPDKLPGEEPDSDLSEALSKGKGDRFPWLKVGIIVIGFSVGLFIIGILASYKLLDNGAFPLGILGICGGISMIIANFLKRGESNR